MTPRNSSLRSSFQKAPVPVRQIRCGFIGRLQKSEQRFIRRLGCADGIVRQDEFSEIRTVECSAGFHRRFGETTRLGIGIGIEHR